MYYIVKNDNPKGGNPAPAIDYSEIIGCEYCLTGDDGELLIGAQAQAGECRPRARLCPSCGAPLCEDAIVAVGIQYPQHREEARYVI